MRRAILVIFVGWLGIHLLINIPMVKNRAATFVANKLGMPGPVTSGWISFLPWNGWTVQNPQLGEKNDAHFSADKLRLKVRWWPLLRKRLEILDLEWINPSAVGMLSHTGVVTVPGGLDIDLLAELQPDTASPAPPPIPPENAADPTNKNNVSTPPGEKIEPSIKPPAAEKDSNQAQAARPPPRPRFALNKMRLRGGSFTLLHPESDMKIVSLEGLTVDWSGNTGTLQIDQAALFDEQIVIKNIGSPLEKHGPLVAAPDLQGTCNGVVLKGVFTLAPGYSALPFQAFLTAENVPLDLSTPNKHPLRLNLTGINAQLVLKGYARFPSSWTGSAIGSFAHGKLTGSEAIQNLLPRLDGGQAAMVIHGGYAHIETLRLESPLITVIGHGTAGGDGLMDIVTRVYMDDKVRSAFSRSFLNESDDSALHYQQLFGRDGHYRDILIRGRGADALTNLMGDPLKLKELPVQLQSGFRKGAENDMEPNK